MYKVLTETPINQYVQPITLETLPPSNPLKMVASETENALKKHTKHGRKSDMRDQVRISVTFVF